MNTTQSDARQSDAFVERALARINHVKRVAQELTEALGLPKEAYHAVLSGMTPVLLEELAERERAAQASNYSSERSLREKTSYRS
jgi:hypothetical protein